MLRIVIIDDEDNARSTLRGMLEQFCEGIKIVGEADSVKTGVHAVLANKPDLVFLDIQMRDGTGFDLLEMLPEIPFTVIFVTAYDQYALKAFAFSASGYLLKPIDLEALQTSVKSVQENRFRSNDARLMREFLKEKTEKKFPKIILPTQNGLEIVDLARLIRCEGDNSYTTFHLLGGKKIMVSKTLKVYAELLADQGFVRIYVSHLINLEHVNLVKHGRGGEVQLSDGTMLPIARNRRKELIDKLETQLLNVGK
ncbi:MAG TPA: response regulator transcription factor [Bacteroidetes bacterium]|nr:response regulator transcription factor [Bacteroidota bacterium]